jgi:chromosomal replication initiation ATPase DnaA
VHRTDKGAGDPLKLILAVCRWLNVSALDVLSGDRHRPIPEARHWICWWLYYRENWSRDQISELMGINYGSVSYALRRINRLRKYDPSRYEELRTLLR